MTASAEYRIAIDGPSGAGKSTIAKRVARILGIEYIDTGAMYRAVALKLIRSGVDAINEPDKLEKLLDTTHIDIEGDRIILDGEDVTEKIRAAEISAEASRSSAAPAIREKLVSLQRAMGGRKSVVMDGRDIGTNVFKDAEYKFFMTATPEERANRRYKELRAAGSDDSFDDVLAAIKKRDYDDSHRALNPLSMANDAILIDTDGLGIEEVTELVLSKIHY